MLFNKYLWKMISLPLSCVCICTCMCINMYIHILITQREEQRDIGREEKRETGREREDEDIEIKCERTGRQQDEF